jgi:hypothetical protein
VTSPWTRVLFRLSGLYDGVLGLAFLFAGTAIYDRFGIPPPNHPGYVQFPALLLVVFAAMFLRIASDPARYRDLIPYGMGLKASYASVVLFHALRGNIPAMWVPFAWADLAFLLLFFVAWRSTAR